MNDDYGPYGPTLSAQQLVEKRRNDYYVMIGRAELRLGARLTAWQTECAVAYLTINDFMTSGRGSGKTFLLDFMRDAGLPRV